MIPGHAFRGTRRTRIPAKSSFSEFETFGNTQCLGNVLAVSGVSST